MLGSCARTFANDPISRHNFILGDFFVVEPSSKCLFDTNMTLKEDYDFTCSHIKAHGSVCRLNRMTLSVRHYSNVGGAVDARDAAGVKERANIAILNKKWPGCFVPNWKRANEVLLRWKGLPADAEQDEAVDEQDDEAKGNKRKRK